jgi:NAD+ synthase (glutamine-hydrolysing)
MKIALAQLNYTVGDITGNKNKIIGSIEKARREKADLIVFSELAICGYPPHDLLMRKKITDDISRAMCEISDHCTDIAAIVGAPSENFLLDGKRLYNSARVLQKGKCIFEAAHKKLLSSYDVYDEHRYFNPDHCYNKFDLNDDHSFTVFEYKGKRIAVIIGDELWRNSKAGDALMHNQSGSDMPLSMRIALQVRPDFIINIAATPFTTNRSYDKNYNRNAVLAFKASCPLLYVNQVGASSELIFDGGSMVINEGKITYRMKRFEEDLFFVDTENWDDKDLSENDIDLDDSSEIRKPEIKLIYDALVLGIRDYFAKSGLKKALLGISGGLDSAVVAALAVAALGNENVHGLLLPSKYSSNHSITDAVALANNLGMSYDTVTIKDVYDRMEATLAPLFNKQQPDVTEENIQARIRGMLLMAYSNKFGHIVLNTSNKSEAAAGYGTLYGDMCGALSVLGDVYKTDVYRLAHYINSEKEIIPLNTIQKPPSAELRPDQKDSDSLPDYEILDAILYRYIELNFDICDIVYDGYDEETVKRIVTLLHRNEYKRAQCSPILRVSSRAFGTGWRMPLVAKYNV